MYIARIVVALFLVLIFSPIASMAESLIGPADQAYNKQDFSEAAKLLRPLAEQGNSDAQLKLGILYQFGRGVPQDYSESMKWYKEAENQGNSAAKERITALEERIKTKNEREPIVVSQPKVKSDFGAGLKNVLGATAMAAAAVQRSSQSTNQPTGNASNAYSNNSASDACRAARCQGYARECGNSQSACQLAAACAYQCKLDSLPPDDPSVGALRDAIATSKANAEALSHSNYVIDTNYRPSQPLPATPYAPPSRDFSQDSDGCRGPHCAR